MNSPIVGIDLGTTNSEIAAFHDGEVRILGSGNELMLPSCVGMSPDGALLIGQAARNQQLLYPDRTIRSIKRRMGDREPLPLGDRAFTPAEISGLILRELRDRAETALGGPVERAIITVPAYFSDAQRQATREAGGLAGLEVVRLINEPTAASLAYGPDRSGERTVMVYDLGGGTFDVAVVAVGESITEVLASHGNSRLGGDDFDQLLCRRLVEVFEKEHGLDLSEEEHRPAMIRLQTAAEEAKKKLSAEPFVRVREETLVEVGGRPLHLDHEISRGEYETMITPLIESTLESVARALEDSGRNAHELDVVLLVGGSTRTPLISEVLEERLGRTPRQDVHPDLCVALGAGLLAAREAGHDVERVLVDVSPFTFGVSHLGRRDGEYYPYCYRPIIRRNTPLPISRTDLFYTSYDNQCEVEVEVFQGDEPDALDNVHVGSFLVSGLAPVPEGNEVLCRMRLDASGLLEVTATEKRTNLSKQVTIANALDTRANDEARRRVEEAFAARADEETESALSDEEAAVPVPTLQLSGSVPSSDREAAPSDLAQVMVEAKGLVSRCREILGSLHADDRTDAVDLNEGVESAMHAGDTAAIREASESLREFLFFAEGK